MAETLSKQIVKLKARVEELRIQVDEERNAKLKYQAIAATIEHMLFDPRLLWAANEVLRQYDARNTKYHANLQELLGRIGRAMVESAIRDPNSFRLRMEED